MPRLALTAVLLCLSPAVASDPLLIVVAGRVVPKGGTVIVVTAGKPGPGEKDHQAVVTLSDFEKTAALPRNATFDLYFKPKAGLTVKMAAGWEPSDKPVALSDHLGTVFVRGDELPRADAVVVTATTDPGPGAKGHTPIQKAGDYKEDMVVPPGTYAVWVVPFNGAKAQRVADNIRVLAGRETKVD